MMDTTTTTHLGRIVGPILYRSRTGRKQQIPLGPCLVERHGERAVDIVWGASGQASAALPIDAIDMAQDHGHLVLLD